MKYNVAVGNYIFTATFFQIKRTLFIMHMNPHLVSTLRDLQITDAQIISFDRLHLTLHTSLLLNIVKSKVLNSGYTQGKTGFYDEESLIELKVTQLGTILRISIRDFDES